MARISSRNQNVLISRTSILILSSFVIGLSVGNVAHAELAPYVLVCGLCGFLAYIALEMASLRRELAAFQQDQRQIEDRLDRHVLSESSAGFQLPGAAVLTQRGKKPEITGDRELTAV
jgi:TRAP-type mannitol/chloroaromatic compound transport system permease large subunit